jgi:hypothetical protein
MLERHRVRRAHNCKAWLCQRVNQQRVQHLYREKVMSACFCMLACACIRACPFAGWCVALWHNSCVCCMLCVRVHVCVCMCVRMCVRARVHVMCVCICVCMCIYMWVCLCERIRMRMCMSVSMYVCMSVCVYVCACVCVRHAPTLWFVRYMLASCHTPAELHSQMPPLKSAQWL